MKLKNKIHKNKNETKPKFDLIFQSGGDGGGLNSPSKRSCPESTTSLVNPLISPARPLMTESGQASRLIFRSPYQRPDCGTSTLRHPILTRRGGVRLDALPI